jgi:hypothetical protein
MPTIHEISRAMNISLKKLRSMEKRGWLLCDAKAHPMVESMLSTMRSGNPLTVAQCVALIEDPKLFDLLEGKAAKARQQVEALGNPKPAAIDWIDLSAATLNDENSEAATLRLIAWIKAVLPVSGRVSHHWIAVRLLLAVPEDMRRFEIPRLGKIMLTIRKHPEFAGWFTIAKQGSRNVTWYHRPKAKGFDL